MSIMGVGVVVGVGARDRIPIGPRTPVRRRSDDPVRTVRTAKREQDLTRLS